MKKDNIEEVIKNWFKVKKKKFFINKNLFKIGVIDSFEVIDFILFLEKEFKIKFKSSELQNPNFLTIKNLISLIKKKNV